MTSASKHLKDPQGEEELDLFYTVHRARPGALCEGWNVSEQKRGLWEAARSHLGHLHSGSRETVVECTHPKGGLWFFGF